jgi:hypothetical protein
VNEDNTFPAPYITAELSRNNGFIINDGETLAGGVYMVDFRVFFTLRSIMIEQSKSSSSLKNMISPEKNPNLLC